METLLGLALKSLLIAGVTLALLHLTRRRSAAERSLIAHLGLVALVALPLASLALPALRVELPAALVPQQEIAAPVQAAPEISGERPATAGPVFTPAAASAPSEPPFDWAPYAYAVPVTALLLVTLIALLRLFALRHRAHVLVDPAWLSALAHAQRRMGFKHGTALLISNELTSPISWGLLRPVILLNEEALEARDEAEAIIAHELAHVAGLDWAKLMLARVATAIFWFNPLAWVLAREAHQLREEAADDAVLTANIADTDYAQLLVGIARHECKGLLLGAHGVAPGKGSLRRRVSRVLDATLTRTPATKSWIAGFGAGMLVMAAPLAALTLGPKEQAPKDSLTGTKVAEARPQVAPISTFKSATSVAAVAATHPHPWTEAEAEAREAAIEAHKERVDKLDVRNKALHGKKDAIDHAIEMKLMGVTPEYAAAIRASGPQFRNLDAGELVALKAQRVTPELVRSIVAAGYGNESPDTIGEAAVMGVTSDYIREIKAAGYGGASLDELTEMRTMGVTGAYIKKVRRTGYGKLTAKQLIKLREHGMDAEDSDHEPPATPDPPPSPH
ncbi:MAG: M56 family metallopeptidase [Sphingomicrobium sp.]